jgi:short-subunit dehydrogenase
MLHNAAQGAKLSIPKFMILSADFVAKKGVAACLKGKAMIIPGLSNRMNMLFVQMIPKIWMTRIFGIVYRKLQSST